MDPSEQKEQQQQQQQQQKKKPAVENYYFVARRMMTRQRHPIRRHRSFDSDFDFEMEHRNYYQTSQRLVELKFD